jgi:hypothetical protein
MRKIWITLSSVLFIALLLGACGDKQNKGNLANMDAEGEEDTVYIHRGTPTKDLIKLTANGSTKEFTFADATNTFTGQLVIYDGGRTMIRIERGSTDKMREKVALAIVNHDPRSLSYPFTLPKEAASKMFSLQYDVQKSNVFINYRAQDTFDMTLTSFKDDVLEGTFSAEVKNMGNKVIKIENGSFKVKLEVQDQTNNRPVQ